MAHNKDAVRKILAAVKEEGRNAPTAPEGKLVCDAYGAFRCRARAWPVTPTGAVELADKMGYPVVLKIVSPDILHKTEAGGVLVGLKSAADVERGYLTIVGNAKKYDPNASIVGVQVQQMITGGREVIIGAVTDPSFGKLVAFGLGGVLVEVLKGHYLPHGPGQPGRMRCVDARRHCRRRSAQKACAAPIRPVARRWPA
ncbi:acetate--CoA ligase family protein [Cupriavidus basilensis]